MSFRLRVLNNTGDPFCLINGTPLSGASITLSLVDHKKKKKISVFDRLTGELACGQFSLSLDSNGEFSTGVWPNSRGEVVSFYRVDVSGDTIKPFFIYVNDAENDCSLAEARAAVDTPEPTNPSTFDSLIAKVNEALGTVVGVVTTTTNGLMSFVDKVKLDGIAAGANNYTHPVNHSPSIIAQDSNNRFVTDTEIASWNSKQEAGSYEPSVAAGVAGQYYSGNKTWQTLNAAAVGLGNVANESKATMFTSPTFTGVPLTPTAAADTSTTQVASTAFVVGQASSTNPAVNGVAAVGTSLKYARADHVHGTDTTRAPLASPAFTGTPTSTTAAVDTNSTQIATTAFVLGQASSTTPLVASGAGAVGTSTRFARADHTHPTQADASTLSSFSASQSGGASKVVVTDSNGNIGLGLTPSAWVNFRAVQFGMGSAIYSNSVGTSSSLVGVANNSYESGAATQKYVTNGAAALYQQSGNTHYWFSAPTGTAGGVISWTQALTLDSSGNLLIGYASSNGSYKLQVNSQIFATSATVATSDARYKTVRSEITDGLEIVRSLRPVTFNWKAHQVHNFDTENEVTGFLAQEVLVALGAKGYKNSVVKESSCKLPDGTDEKFLGIAEGNLIPILTSAIKELLARVEALEARG